MKICSIGKAKVQLQIPTIAEGEPQKLEHNDIQWIMPSEIPNYEFCPADEEILRKIQSKS